MIRVFLGKPGSGKTLMAVKEMYVNSDMKYVSNIQTNRMNNVIPIKRDHLIKETLLGVKKSGEPIKMQEFNKDYWINLKKSQPMLNITLDEIHNIYDARRAMSKEAKIMNDFLALIRKILSDASANTGVLTMITQIDRRLDIVGIEMANLIKYHICYYMKMCKDCHYSWSENNEEPLPKLRCPNCDSISLTKHSHVIRSFFFDSIMAFNMWRFGGQKTYFAKTDTRDGKFYFDKYNTMQWEDLLK